jgi:hypothetical protein
LLLGCQGKNAKNARPAWGLRVSERVDDVLFPLCGEPQVRSAAVEKIFVCDFFFFCVLLFFFLLRGSCTGATRPRVCFDLCSCKMRMVLGYYQWGATPV